MAIKKEVRDKIKAQALTNMSFARRYKQGKIRNWQKSEQMYYGQKQKTDESRANVDLAQMQEHVHVLLSKIDSPLTFKFLKTKESQLKKVNRLNALKQFDTDRDFWNMKDIVGKKQMVIYGRAMFSYHASSEAGYEPHLENIDVYDFLIDPSAGGVDVEKARFLGHYGVIKDRSELKSKMYIKSEVDQLLAGSGNNTERNQEELNKSKRITANEHWSSQQETQDEDKFVFWNWYETYNGKRYYLMMTEDGCVARCEELGELFDSNLWPIWTYAAYPDLTEFWTPSPADYVREILMAQSVSINQMLDNAERVNRPQRAVDVTAEQNLAELKYRKDGWIKMNAGTNIASAVKALEVPSINTPIAVFETLERIKQAATGVTDGAKGVADTDGRATIYEGNEANVADRFGLFNKSYSFGYQRFGKLYEAGVKEHLNKKVAVQILGPEGIEVENIGRRDIFRGNDEFALMTEQSNAELQLSEQKRRQLGAFYAPLLGRPDLANQKIVIEQLGSASGVEEETVRQLLDLDEYGTATVLSEAARDMESLLDGQTIQPNRIANTAYKQYFVDYSLDHEEDMSLEQTQRVLRYIQSLDQVVISNTQRAAQEQARRELSEQAQAGPGAARGRQPGPSQPFQDVIQQNVNT